MYNRKLRNVNIENQALFFPKIRVNEIHYKKDVHFVLLMLQWWVVGL